MLVELARKGLGRDTTVEIEIMHSLLQTIYKVKIGALRLGSKAILKRPDCANFGVFTDYCVKNCLLSMLQDASIKFCVLHGTFLHEIG